MNFKAEIEDSGLKPVLLNYGGAEKFVAEMNEEELAKASQSIRNRAKERRSRKDFRFTTILDDKVVAEYADGRIVPIKE